MSRLKSGEPVTVFPFDLIPCNAQRIELLFENLRPPIETFAVRVFVDTPDANVQTATDENPGYLGTQFFYGLGNEADAVLSAYPASSTDQASLTNVHFNITRRVKNYISQTVPHLAYINLVAVDRHGREITHPDLECSRISVVVR